MMTNAQVAILAASQYTNQHSEVIPTAEWFKNWLDEKEKEATDAEA